MARTACTTFGLVGMLLGANCGHSDDMTGITAWAGSEVHLRVQGTVHGEMIDINIAAPDAENTVALWCEREYQVPNDVNGKPIYSMGHNSEVRFKAPVTIAGQARLLDFGIKRHNSQVDAAGTVVNIIPRDDANSPCSLNNCPKGGPAWMSLTWRNPADNSVLYKSAAISGTWTLGEFLGTPDQNGLFIPPNTGTVGGYGSGVWTATESLALTVTAHCTVNQVDNTY